MNYNSSFNKLKRKCEANYLSISRDEVNGRAIAIINNRIVVYLDNHYWHDIKYFLISSSKKHQSQNSGGDKLDSKLRKLNKEIKKQYQKSRTPYVMNINTLKYDHVKRISESFINPLKNNKSQI